MPQLNVASIGNFDFGAPESVGEVLRFRVKDKRGGKLIMHFENPDGVANVTVSAEVSSDGSSFSATTAANNLAAVTSLVVQQRAGRDATILLREGTDNYLRITASGGARAILQLRGDVALEPVTI